MVAARKRTRSSAKAAGATFERQIADYLRDNLDDRIDRRVKTGAADKGDLANIRISSLLGGGRVVAELKNTAKLNVGPHLQEAEKERVNDSATVGVVVSKRHGIGDAGKQLVIMTVDDFIGLLIGERPKHE